MNKDCIMFAQNILQDFLVSEEEFNSVEFEAIYSRKSLNELLSEIYNRLAKIDEE